VLGCIEANSHVAVGLAPQGVGGVGPK
jgi:hypothetical protein